MGKRLLTLDIGSLVAGTKYRGEFEERLKKIIEEVKNSQLCPLHRRAAHARRAGAAEGAVDAANILKPSLARGEPRRSARRRWMSTASTSSGTRRWSGASSRPWSRSRVSRRRSRS